MRTVHFVIMGCGRVGATLAQNLEENGHSVSVIDQNPEAFRRLDPGFEGNKVTGLGFDRDTLTQAGIEDAFAFAAVSDGDNSNILAARVVRETFGIENVVARIYDPHRAEIYQRLGIPTVATVRWTAFQVLRRLLPMGASDEFRDYSGKIQLSQIDIHAGLGGQAAARPRGGQRRPRGVRHPLRRRHPADVDHRPAGERHRARAAAGRRVRPGRTHPHRGAGGVRVRVVIAGAGSVGRSIARELLGHGHEVTLIDRQPSAMRVSQVADADWLLADACELPTLRQVKADEADVVVAATGDDKANLVISLLAKTEFGVPRTVARVNNPKNEWMFDEAWGVDVAVSTPRIMTAMVEEAVTVGDLVRIFTFHQSRADILELTLPEDSPLAGVRVGQIEWPADTVLAAIVRDTRPIAPSPDDTLEGRDELLFVTGRDADESELERAVDPRTSDPADPQRQRGPGQAHRQLGRAEPAGLGGEVQRDLDGEAQAEQGDPRPRRERVPATQRRVVAPGDGRAPAARRSTAGPRAGTGP